MGDADINIDEMIARLLEVRNNRPGKEKFSHGKINKKTLKIDKWDLSVICKLPVNSALCHYHSKLYFQVNIDQGTVTIFYRLFSVLSRPIIDTF